MSARHKNPDQDVALGETIAALPEMREHKDEASRRLVSGENRGSVFSHLVEVLGESLNDQERLFGFDRSTAE